MSESLQYIRYIYSKFISWVFDEAVLVVDSSLGSNVTLGWVCISVIVFMMLIKSILNIPRGMTRWSNLGIGSKDDRKGDYSKKQIEYHGGAFRR